MHCSLVGCHVGAAVLWSPPLGLTSLLQDCVSILVLHLQGGDWSLGLPTLSSNQCIPGLCNSLGWQLGRWTEKQGRCWVSWCLGWVVMRGGMTEGAFDG